MSGKTRTCAILSASLAIALLSSCGKQEPGAAQPGQAIAIPGKWQQSLPLGFMTLTLKDAGGCYLDVVNGVDAGGSARAASGTPVGLAGWAVADVKQGRIGSALGVMLMNGSTSYYTTAGSYARPGLGAALNGSSTLDAGGLKLNPSPLNVPAGDYRVIFLIQSDRDLLRCDTGRSLHIE